MNQDELKQRVERLQEISQVIDKLPAEIRIEAFQLLKDYVTQSPSSRANGGTPQAEDDAEGNDGTEFFAKFDHNKPSDNVRLITAFLFQKYGAAPFSGEEVKSIATNVGITVPDRVDMTIAAATENGKQFFTRVGRGKFKPTVHGETWMKATYGVKKGTQVREDGDK
jgi:hypothetical protein